jgi:hypothetical protein
MGEIEAIDALRAWIDQQRIDGVAVISDCVRDDEPCLYVYVTSPDAADRLPAEFRGFKLHIEGGDPVRALEVESETSGDQPSTSRPAPEGGG